MRLSFVLRANLESTQNNLLCFDFFRRCVDFGDIILAFSDTFIGYPTLSRVRGSNELQERAMALATEAADVLAEGSTQSQGSRKFNSLYKQSLALLWKMTLGLNTLLESASSWMIVTDALPDAPAGGISLGLLREQSCAWAKGRASIRMGLAALTNDPVERLRYHCLSLSSPRPRSLMTRRMMRLVCFA
ncbi:hypothetical protein BJV74DRAFT_302753 [Russula compacta]|nr:hypothetical protein BJV74DRAFT_302753 [Russula compacta]